jgi:hypothetical protein
LLKKSAMVTYGITDQKHGFFQTRKT